MVQKGGNTEINFYDDYEMKSEEKDESSSTNLNAFDIISFSSGLDLSGLFDNSHNAVDDSERFISAESPEKIVEKLEEFARAENLKVKKHKEFGVELDAQSRNLVVGIEIFGLTDGLVVVEVRRKCGDSESFKQMLKKKLKGHLTGNEASTSTSR